MCEGRRCRCAWCLCCLIFIAGPILAIIILSIVFSPHKIAVTVDSATLSAFTLSASSTLAYNLTVDMTVRNTNRRLGLYYGSVEALALFDGQRFGYAPLGAFFQDTQASTKLSPAFRGQQVLVDGPEVTPANFRSQQSSGAFHVEVKLNANLRFKPGWTTNGFNYRARISCPLSLPTPGAAASPAFTPVECKVWFDYDQPSYQ